MLHRFTSVTDRQTDKRTERPLAIASCNVLVRGEPLTHER